ncbi:MAG: hypothetical protein GC137_08995 [Alphaproteobacteria bacterium]|nr:hypothetical protein [Alphaproteobacteria bacterium]
MKKLFVFFLICLAVPVFAQSKSNSDLAISIANERIDITVGFTGSSIELFGDRRDKNTNVAITVEGPREDVTLWQKAKIAGTWVNRYHEEFKDIPLYYHHAMTAEESDPKIQAVLKEHNIGHEALFGNVKGDSEGKEQREAFARALVEKQIRNGLYFAEPATFKFMNDNFFRVRFDIPASAQTGEYKIRSYLIKNGRVVGKTLDVLQVEQVGLNAFIFNAAQSYSLFYALTCIMLAFFSGWLVSVLRVRP